MLKLSLDLEQFIDTLPDSNSVRVFIERLFEEHPTVATRYLSNQDLMANLCTLASYSNLLSESLLQRPEYISWLAREKDKDLTKLKDKEALLEDLARFVAINSTLSEPARLARFKRRELLRIYLRDCLKLATLSEVTAELSNLADSVLSRTLQVCYQPLLSRYGRPQILDERGRFVAAEFAIIGLGKLGSFELNYSSDIDLIFIYSSDGETAGTKETVSNKYFFTKLAESIVKTISSSLVGEGAVFRIDLRLRPRGREGDLVVSLAEMLRYYRKEAQNWERQALIRARACAGDETLVEKLLSELKDQIYKPEPLIEALKSVQQTKEKIDRDVAKRSGGYNVKLGKGGIREIEFIIQALQICYGGKDSWLRAPQTLIGLQRLADKNLISDYEHTQLAQAYTFLRTVEHRLQMEHGLQTHSLPTSEEKLLLLAHRCGFENYPAFDQVLQNHCQNVQSIYQRVFGQTQIKETNKFSSLDPAVLNISSRTQKNLIVPIANLEELFQETILELASKISLSQTAIAEAIAEGLNLSINSARALRRLKDFALSASTETSKSLEFLTKEQLQKLTVISGNSQYLIQLLISQPYLINSLGQELIDPISITRESIYQNLSSSLANLSLDEAMIKFRICWHQEIIKLGCYDVLKPITNFNKALQELRQINLVQTSLAEVCLELATNLALSNLLERYTPTQNPITYSILGLGRLGHCGIDYHSDLDIVFIYSDSTGEAVEEICNREFFSKLVELIIQILSTLKREGTLYRVDLRLRPDGKNGLLATSFENLQNYLQERAAVWELMAYLKAHAVVGQTEFCKQVESQVPEIIFSKNENYLTNLATEIDDIRKRLETQKGREIDFKFGAGGMLDVYFVTRYLQLKHKIADPETRGTLALITHLAEKNLLTSEQKQILSQGYGFLRLLDHQLRLQLERPQTFLPHNASQRMEIAKQLSYQDEANFNNDYQQHLSLIRQVYQEIIA
ncbi:MAG: bifunctional [glutamate--ammonia ligase]-adenylyl-L-tyrosine phosphorylase/[glutamate--ammonia-ligase] adenylyltransferase [Blastocatellia bacterium]|nr:bifunctional [glutamate--ammonia ligase]-adenylyl-L-tyrosine phosphorylase/[glutamate--ammonia-ligase] adenylyltransferase [Blastocatellia bacterium]